MSWSTGQSITYIQVLILLPLRDIYFHTLQYKTPCILYYIAKVSDGLICQPGTKILHLSCTNADVLSCLSTKTKTFYLGFANFTSTFWGQTLDKIAFKFLNSSNLTKYYLTFDKFNTAYYVENSLLHNFKPDILWLNSKAVEGLGTLYWNGILVHDFLPNMMIFFHLSFTVIFR